MRAISVGGVTMLFDLARARYLCVTALPRVSRGDSKGDNNSQWCKWNSASSHVIWRRRVWCVSPWFASLNHSSIQTSVAERSG